MTDSELISFETVDRCIEYAKTLNGFEKEFNPLAEFIPYVATKEIVHTKILHSLLSQSEDVLKDFISEFLPDVDLNMIHDLSVIKERKVKRVISAGGDRSIDLLIEWNDGNKECHAIIVENKLNGAYFQEIQIEEYNASLKSENIQVEGTIVLYDNDSYGNICFDEIETLSVGPKKLARWILSKLDQPNIIAYANYLSAMNTPDKNEMNSIQLLQTILSSESPLENLRYIADLTEAFSMLNYSKGEYLANRLRGNFPDVCFTVDELDGKALAIQLWESAAREKNGLWIALLIPENPINDKQGTDLYIYSYADNDSSNYRKIIGKTGYEEVGVADPYRFFSAPTEKFRYEFFDEDSRNRLVAEIERLLTLFAEDN